mmetsp:Transcript_18840/g.53231  ORF Transcript_18840/g.53231 Transcript_18840/m.53231 type:complete len:128 (-) Transcript_18840:953-1336(-)
MSGHKQVCKGNFLMPWLRYEVHCQSPTSNARNSVQRELPLGDVQVATWVMQTGPPLASFKLCQQWQAGYLAHEGHRVCTGYGKSMRATCVKGPTISQLDAKSFMACLERAMCSEMAEQLRLTNALHL